MHVTFIVPKTNYNHKDEVRQSSFLDTRAKRDHQKQ